MNVDGSPTRERLLDAAVERIWRHGFAATSLADIRSQAGVHGGSLYHFFPSKEALLLAVLQRHAKQLEPFIFEPALERHDAPVDQVFAVLEIYREFLQSTDCALGCPIGNLALEVSDDHPGVRAGVARIFDDWAERIFELLRKAGDSFSPDTDLRGLSRFVLTVMEGGVMQAKAHRSLAPFDASVAHLRRYVEGLMVTGASRDGSGSVKGAEH